MEEEIFTIENEKNSVRLFRDNKDYLLRLNGTVYVRSQFGQTTEPVAQYASVTYRLKPGDIKQLLHALIDLDKL